MHLAPPIATGRKVLRLLSSMRFKGLELFLFLIAIAHPCALWSQDEPLGGISFVPKIHSQLREQFEGLEERERKAYEWEHGDDSPMQYPAYRLTPPIVHESILPTQLDEACNILGLKNPSTDQKRKVLLAYIFSKTLPAQMKAGDKHMRVRPVRLRYARDFLYDSLSADKIRWDIAGEARAQYSVKYLYRIAQKKYDLTSDQALSSEQLCEFLPKDSDFKMNINWQYTDEKTKAYPFLQSSNKSSLQLRQMKCDPKQTPDKVLDHLYQRLRVAQVEAIDQNPIEFFEPVYFHVNRSNGFEVDFSKLPYNLFMEYKDADVTTWGKVSIVAPKAPVNEEELMDLIYETLNPHYLRDIFRSSVLRYAEANASGNDEARKLMKEVDWKDVTDYYRKHMVEAEAKDKSLSIELLSFNIPYKDPVFDDQIDGIFEDERKKTMNELKEQISKKIRPDSELESSSKAEQSKVLSSLRSESLRLMVERIAARLNVEKKKVTQDQPVSIKGSMNENWKKFEKTAWAGPLQSSIEALKAGKKTLLAIGTDLTEAEDGTRNFRIGGIIKFEVPALYDSQLELFDQLRTERQDEFFKFAYKMMLKDAAVFRASGPSSWNDVYAENGVQTEDLIKAKEEQEVLDLAVALYHERTKHARPDQYKPWLVEDFIPRMKKQDKGWLFNMLP